MSDVFDFNDSLNDFAPVSPILFAVDVKRKDRVNVDGVFYLVSFVFTPQIEFSECCV